jgi:hypothetical protein
MKAEWCLGDIVGSAGEFFPACRIRLSAIHPLSTKFCRLASPIPSSARITDFVAIEMTETDYATLMASQQTIKYSASPMSLSQILYEARREATTICTVHLYSFF